jgi:DNA-directed RNA polymerase subunit M/transcription elongation factor TFIIS
MEFCDVCENMLFLRLDKDGVDDVSNVQLKYFCETSKNSIISRTNYEDNKTSYKQYISAHIAEDKTLPRVNNIECPECKTNTEVIYVKYDTINLKFLYHCTQCKKYWR